MDSPHVKLILDAAGFSASSDPQLLKWIHPNQQCLFYEEIARILPNHPALNCLTDSTRAALANLRTTTTPVTSGSVQSGLTLADL